MVQINTFLLFPHTLAINYHTQHLWRSWDVRISFISWERTLGLVVCLFFFFLRPSHCSPSWPKTPYTEQAGLNFWDPWASASWVLGPKACTTMLDWALGFFMKIQDGNCMEDAVNVSMHDNWSFAYWHSGGHTGLVVKLWSRLPSCLWWSCNPVS